jgi:DNA mismatch endonuclease (patch repair protein)
MRSNRRTDTSPERELRAELHGRGLRFRKDFPIRLPVRARVRPDIVFTRTKLAVFVDGCFWHQCPVHGTMPKSNVDYWEPKLQANVARDRRVDELLREHGWAVLRLWEHDDACRAADRVVEAIRRFDVGAMDRGSVPSAADEEPGNIGSAEH